MSHDLNYYYLQQLGIDCWVSREPVYNTPSSAPRTSVLCVWGEGEKEKILSETQLLERMLASVGLTAPDVSIVNVLKDKKSNTRDLSAAEMDACRIVLNEQIQLHSPRLILALGQFVGQFLFGEPESLDALRTVLHRYESHSDSKNGTVGMTGTFDTRSIPFLVTFHPADLLRNPQQKKLAYGDLLLVKEVLRNDAF